MGGYMGESTRWEHRLRDVLIQHQTWLKFQIQVHPLGRLAGLYLQQIGYFVAGLEVLRFDLNIQHSIAAFGRQYRR